MSGPLQPRSNRTASLGLEGGRGMPHTRARVDEVRRAAHAQQRTQGHFVVREVLHQRDPSLGALVEGGADAVETAVGGGVTRALPLVAQQVATPPPAPPTGEHNPSNRERTDGRTGESRGSYLSAPSQNTSGRLCSSRFTRPSTCSSTLAPPVSYTCFSMGEPCCLLISRKFDSSLRKL